LFQRSRNLNLPDKTKFQYAIAISRSARDKATRKYCSTSYATELFWLKKLMLHPVSYDTNE